MARIPGKGDETTRSSHAVDTHVGGRIRSRRVEQGLSQEQLAGRLGLTSQQVQKYETGANRVDASRLFDLARVLDVQVNYFFEAITPPDELMPGELAQLPPDSPTMPATDFTLKRETLELVRAFKSIADPATRQQVSDLAKALTEPLPTVPKNN